MPHNKTIKKSVIKKTPIVLEKSSKEFYFLFEKIIKNINQAPTNNFRGIKFFNTSSDN